MKHNRAFDNATGTIVAPRRGAWVETIFSLLLLQVKPVAPRRGAWVETLTSLLWGDIADVAPRRGAWVETSMVCSIR